MSDRSDIDLDLQAAYRAWGRGQLPMGTILCGCTRRSAIIYLPTGWHLGAKGVVTELVEAEARELQRQWLQAIRARYGWEAAEAVYASHRTWQGWEQGRTLPFEVVYAICTEVLE